MKLSRKQRFSKPLIIKRNSAQTDYFHQKESQIKPLPLQSNPNQERLFNFYANNRQAKRFDSQISSSKGNQLKPSDATSQKNWWIHLWSGLVLDRQAKHKQAISQAIWLYLYFLLVANRESGKLYRRLSTIAAETGFNPRSIQRWLHTLREKGYIETRSTGRFLKISITKWKPISRRKNVKYQSGDKQTGSIHPNNSQSHNEKFG